MYGVIVVRPDGLIESWVTDSLDQWAYWNQRLTQERADFIAWS